MLAIELFVRGRRCGGRVGRRIFDRGGRWRRRRSLSRRWRLPHLRGSQRRLIRLRRTPTGWSLRRRAVRATLSRRSAVTLRRTDGGAERIQALGRTGLVARRLCGSEAGLSRWRAPSNRRSGRRRCGSCCRRRLVTAATPLSGRSLLRRRRVLRSLRRWRTPLARRGSDGRRCDWSRRVMRGRALRARCRRPRARRRRRQGRATRQAKLAGGLVGCATPRADDHESDSRELRAPSIPGPGPRQQNQGGGSLRGRSIPGFARKGAKSLGVHAIAGGRAFGGAGAPPRSAKAVSIEGRGWARPWTQRSFSSATRAALPLRSRR